ncbi:hypothetical protein [Streptomyces sp. NPDC006997]|uniref:hypothetical protein n=1 Tax=Streptomyces sp. NPDC006997 TaxID=3155356 RepID=UPI0033FDF788
MRSIAVPLRDRTGRAIAAINVATHAARRTVTECLEDVLPPSPPPCPPHPAPHPLTL